MYIFKWIHVYAIQIVLKFQDSSVREWRLIVKNFNYIYDNINEGFIFQKEIFV